MAIDIDQGKVFKVSCVVFEDNLSTDLIMEILDGFDGRDNGESVLEGVPKHRKFIPDCDFVAASQEEFTLKSVKPSEKIVVGLLDESECLDSPFRNLLSFLDFEISFFD